jgi:hypothetical protein
MLVRPWRRRLAGRPGTRDPTYDSDMAGKDYLRCSVKGGFALSSGRYLSAGPPEGGVSCPGEVEGPLGIKDKRKRKASRLVGWWRVRVGSPRLRSWGEKARACPRRDREKGADVTEGWDGLGEKDGFARASLAVRWEGCGSWSRQRAERRGRQQRVDRKNGETLIPSSCLAVRNERRESQLSPSSGLTYFYLGCRYFLPCLPPYEVTDRQRFCCIKWEGRVVGALGGGD